MQRRSFLSTLFASAFSSATAHPIPIIDSHIHLFDVNRPQGVPWPPKNSSIYKRALPDRYQKLAAPFGIVGAIEIECSPWPEDNQWVLDVAAQNSIIVGTIGDLEPGAPNFGKLLERFHRNPLFLGIRYGNLWNRDLSLELSKPAFVNDLKLFAGSGLVMDTANPDPKLIHALVTLTDKVPNLKVVIDHLPELNPPSEASARHAGAEDLKTLGQRPQVFGKISGIVRKVDGRIPLDLAFYHDRLDNIWETFAEDRLFYGSDWPNSDLLAQYPDVFHLASEFISARSRSIMEKFFWKNSLKAYGWVRRNSAQPSLV